jgi:anti-anti-sigma regulatory factor
MLTIKVEGQLLESWVGTVREACKKEGWPERLCLDLTAVTYVDLAGAQLLRDLMHAGIEIASCSTFVAELLGTEKPS